MSIFIKQTLNIYSRLSHLCLIFTLSRPRGRSGIEWLAVPTMLAQMPQLKATEPEPAAIQQICLSKSEQEQGCCLI